MSPFNQNINDITYKQVLKRKQKACRKVYDMYKHPVYNLAFRMLQNQQDAQDISQQSFLTVFQKTDQWSQDVPFGQWLRRIVINQCLDCLKKHCPELSYDQPEQALSNDKPETTQNYDFQHDANHYLKNLSPVMRAILWLYEVEGFTHQEIGHLFNRSESFSKSRLARAKQQLSQSLDQQTQQVNSYEQSL